MAKIQFCNPLILSQSPEEQALTSPYFPLGLLYLAAYVRERGHDVTIFDGTFAEGPEDFDAILQTENPDVVGITALQPTRAMALTLAEIAHRQGKIVILGGPDPTRSPAAYLADPHVDLIVHHEGEQTIAALLDLFDAGDLSLPSLRAAPGIAYREGGQVIVNAPCPPIENLDTLPFPARDLIDMQRYLDLWQEENGYSSLTLSTARGCPYGCEWCREAVHGNQFRQRSPESVAAEMKQLIDTYQIDRLRVIDDVDGISQEWLADWAERAEALGAVIPFEALNDLKRQDIPMLDVRDSL